MVVQPGERTPRASAQTLLALRQVHVTDLLKPTFSHNPAGAASRVEIRRPWEARAKSLLAIRQGDVPKGSATKYPSLEQGPGSDSEASAGGGLAVSDADFQPAAQGRVRAPQGDLDRAVA